jgi:hypothetical protein
MMSVAIVLVPQQLVEPVVRRPEVLVADPREAVEGVVLVLGDATGAGVHDPRGDAAVRRQVRACDLDRLVDLGVEDHPHRFVGGELELLGAGQAEDQLRRQRVGAIAMFSST